MTCFTNDIQEILGKHNPEEVEELLLDGLFQIPILTTNHKEGLEKYKNISKLSLSYLKLSSLSNLPKLPHLKVLELTNNKLKGNDLDQIPKQMPGLQNLKLSNNPLEDLAIFEPLKSSKISSIEIFSTPLVTVKDHRQRIFSAVKSLKVLNHYNKANQKEVPPGDEDFEEEDEDGEYQGDGSFEDEFDEDFYDEEEELELSEA